MERAVLTDNGEHFTHSEREEQWVRISALGTAPSPKTVRVAGWRGGGLKLLKIVEFTGQGGGGRATKRDDQNKKPLTQFSGQNHLSSPIVRHAHLRMKVCSRDYDGLRSRQSRCFCLCRRTVCLPLTIRQRRNVS